jgi:starch-binding outer membrane protein, SusD/RagB family
MKLTIKTALLAGCMIAGLASCKKILDVKPGTELAAEQMYRDVYDANAAVMGIYGKFMHLSDRYIILNELRADLMEFTNNADEYLRQISNHTVTPDNPYINPRPFYELINNCNDVLMNFQLMRQSTKLSEQDFNQRYSDIGCLRSFLYLQLGIHYGEVPYVTEALQNINDVKDLSRFPRLPLKVLLDSLINFTESLPYKDIYTANVNAGTGTSLNIALDGYPTEKFFINKKILLGDLYLWKGNYRKAAEWYRDVMEYATPSGNLLTRYLMYKRGWSAKPNNAVNYLRAGDASSLDYVDSWGTMFETRNDDRFGDEMIWAIPYDSRFKPENPLIKLFSPIGGSYLVKASKEIIDNWNSQEQRPVAGTGALTGIPYDARGLLSQRTLGGQPTITKYIGNYISLSSSLPLNILEKNGTWFLFRAAHLHLRFAEAANRDGYPRLAYVLFNGGIRSYNPLPTGETNATKYMNSLELPEVYAFDGRQGDIPYFRGNWHRNDGVRLRANLLNYKLTATSQADSINQVETGLLNELALETAFEGTRWPDLLRVAMRRNDPSFIADKIYNKLKNNPATESLAPEAKRKLQAGDWFLPFSWE